MIKPTFKSPAINKLLNLLSGKDREEIIRNYGCTNCSRVFPTEDALLEDLGDNISIKEYEISGLCRKCQDNVYNTGE